MSFAIGDPGELVEQAHEAGSLFVHQVHTVAQAERSAKLRVDVLIAQGARRAASGGPSRRWRSCLRWSTLGTCFLACSEAQVDARWQEAIVQAASEDAVKVEFAGSVFPPPAPGGYDTRLRSLRTDFIDQWNERPAEAARESERLGAELIDAVRAGRGHELVPFTGQSAGLIRDVRTAAEIVRAIVAEAEAALRDAAS